MPDSSPPPAPSPATTRQQHTALVALVRCIHGAIAEGRVTPALRHQVYRVADEHGGALAVALRAAIATPTPDPDAPRIVQSPASDAPPTRQQEQNEPCPKCGGVWRALGPACLLCGHPFGVPASDAPARHVCGVQGYDQMRDGPCPACAPSDAPAPPRKRMTDETFNRVMGVLLLLATLAGTYVILF